MMIGILVWSFQSQTEMKYYYLAIDSAEWAKPDLWFENQKKNKTSMKSAPLDGLQKS